MLVLFVGEFEGCQVFAGEKFEGVVVEIAVGLQVAVLELGAEATINFVEKGEPLVHDLGARCEGGVLQARIGVVNGQRAVRRAEKAVAVIRIAVDANRGG